MRLSGNLKTRKAAFVSLSAALTCEIFPERRFSTLSAAFAREKFPERRTSRLSPYPQHKKHAYACLFCTISNYQVGIKLDTLNFIIR